MLYAQIVEYSLKQERKDGQVFTWGAQFLLKIPSWAFTEFQFPLTVPYPISLRNIRPHLGKKFLPGLRIPRDVGPLSRAITSLCTTFKLRAQFLTEWT